MHPLIEPNIYRVKTYQAIHISMGQSHIVAIIKDSIIDKVNINKMILKKFEVNHTLFLSVRKMMIIIENLGIAESRYWIKVNWHSRIQ